MKINLAMLTLSLFLVFTAKAQANETFDITFESLPKLLQSRSSKIAASLAETEAANLRTGSLARSFLPSLNLHSKQSSFTIGQASQKSQMAYGAEVSVNVFNSGRDAIESELREINSDRKKFEHQRVTLDELQRTRSLFWEIVYTQEKIELLQSTMKVNQENLAIAGRRILSGVTTESDRVEFEMKAVDLSRELREAQFKLSEYTSEMSMILNIPEDSKINFPNRISHEHEFEQVLQHTHQDHDYLYKVSELQSVANELAAKSSNRSWWPKLDAFAGYNQYSELEKEYANAADRTESVVGVRLALSFGEAWEAGRESKALLKEAQALKSIAEMQKRETEIHLKNEIASLRFLHGQVHDAEENIARAERYYKLTQSEYVRGVKNSPDVLGASEKIFEMQNKKIEIIRDFQIAKAHVLSKIGK